MDGNHLEGIKQVAAETVPNFQELRDEWAASRTWGWIERNGGLEIDYFPLAAYPIKYDF